MVSVLTQVNWQMLWVRRKKRFGLRILGYLLLTVTILFPVGIFSGESALIPMFK